jgi:glutamate racemase
MTSKTLLFYDSGAGGLPYLAAARTRLPAARYVYLADRKHFPLGEKPAGLVRRLVLESVSLAVKRFDPALVVIACNTASVAALDHLRNHFSIPFVGVVPAVKPAALSTARGKVAVVSTRQTASGPYLERLIREFAGDREVSRISAADLVDFAEYRAPTAGPAERLAAVRRALDGLLEEEVGAVVLGCTHFVLLEEEFRAVLTDRIALVDSREGVTRRIESLLDGGGARAGDARPGGARAGAARAPGGELYLNGGSQEQARYRVFARRFSLRFRGLLEEEGS